MKTVTLENIDLIVDLFEEAWTEQAAIVIYPYEDNMIQLLTQEDLKNQDLINTIYSNEDVALFDTTCFEEVEKYQNLLRDLFQQYISLLNEETENIEKINIYTSIYKLIGGK